MSDLFDEFVFDLQRFDSEAAYGNIGLSAADKKEYTWKADRGFWLYDVDKTGTVLGEGKNDSIGFSLSSPTSKYVEEVHKITPDDDTVGLYVRNSTLSAATTLVGSDSYISFETKGNMYFDMKDSDFEAIHFVDEGDTLVLNEKGTAEFTTGKEQIYFRNDSLSKVFPQFSINVTFSPKKTLALTSETGEFELSGLSVGDGVELLSSKNPKQQQPQLEVDVVFGGSGAEITSGDGFPSYFTDATVGGSVKFNLAKDINISVESGGVVFVANGALSTGVAEANGITVNGMAGFEKIDTKGFVYDNGVGKDKYQIVYFTDADFGEQTDDKLEGTVRNISVGDINASVKGLSEDYSGLILKDGKLAGFTFAAGDSDATLILKGGADLSNFKLYNGYDPTVLDDDEKKKQLISNIPTVTGSDITAIQKSTDEDGNVSFGLVVNDGAVATDGIATINVENGGGSFVSILFDDNGIKGVNPAANPSLSGTTDPKTFAPGLEIKVSDTTSTYESLNGMLFGGESLGNYVAVGSGKYTYSINSDSKAVIELNSEADTVFALADATKLQLVGGSGTVVDATDGDGKKDNDATYGYVNRSGSAYFHLMESAKAVTVTINVDPVYKTPTTISGNAREIDGFVFMDKGDALTIDSLGSASLAVMYEDEKGTPTEVKSTPTVLADSYTIKMTAPYSKPVNGSASVANFAVTNFSESSTVVKFGSGSFTFGTETDEFFFASNGTTFGFNASDTVAMDAGAAKFLDGTKDDGSFLINDEDVNIVARLEGTRLVFNASDGGESSLMGLSTGSKIIDAGNITKIYGTSGADINKTYFVIGGVSYFHNAAGESVADVAYFTVDGTSATGFTFKVENDALKVTEKMPDAFTLTDKNTGKYIDAPTAYVTEGSSTAVDAYTITKGQSSLYEISGLSSGNYIEMETAAGASASITLKDVSASAAIVYDMASNVLAGFANLENGDQIKVAGVSNAVDFNIDSAEDADDVVEIAGDNVSFVYTYGESVAALNDVYADVEIRKLGGASYVQTAAGESGIGSYEFAVSGQSFGVDAYNYASDSFTGLVDGVKFVIGTGSTVTAIAGIDAEELVDGSGSSFKSVTQINGQTFGVSGADYIAVLGTSGANGVTGIYLEDGDNVVVNAAASASIVDAVDVKQIAFGAASAFTIAGKNAELNEDIQETDVEFYLKGMTVAGISDVDVQESISGYFGGVSSVNGVSFEVDDKDAIMIVGNVGASGITKIAKVSDGAVINNVGGASEVVTDTDGSFTFASHSVPFEVKGDSSVTFQMVKGAPAAVYGVNDFIAKDGSVASLKGELLGLTINESEKDIDVTNDADDSFVYMIDDSGANATLGGVGASKATDEVVIKGTGGASVVNVITDGIYTFKLGDALGGQSASFVLNIADDDKDGVNFVLDSDGNVVQITSFDKGDLINGEFENPIAFEGLNNGSLSKTNVEVLGDSSITVDHDAFIIKDVSDLATIKTADGIVLAITDSLAATDTLKVTDTDGDVFIIAGSDSNGVNLVLDGNANIVGVSSLAQNATLRGDLGKLTAINDQPFGVTEIATGQIFPDLPNAGDGQFAVVGASNGIGKIVELGGIVNVTDGGGASQLVTNDNVFLSTGGQSFIVSAIKDFTVEQLEDIKPSTDFDALIDQLRQFNAKSDGVEFSIDENDVVTAVNGLSGNEILESAALGGISINGKGLQVKGADIILVRGTDDEDGISALVVGSGSKVVVTETAGASAALAIDVDEITFGESSTFTIESSKDYPAVGFGLSGVDVKTVALLDDNESVTGDFTDVAAVNDKKFTVVDPDKEIMVVGNDSVDAVSKIAKVSDGAMIANVGGASQVITDTDGEFFFVGHNDGFSLAGDSSVTFEMVKGAAASVAGINGFGQGGESFAVVAGNLNGLSINGEGPINVEDDADEVFAYAATTANGKTSYALAVEGENVTVNNAAGASFIVTGEGKYTFKMDKDSDSTTYTVVDAASDSAVLFELKGNDVVAIHDMEKDTAVVGDFSKGVSLNGNTDEGVVVDTDFVQIAGDSDVMVLYDDFEVRMLSDGASISSATTVYKAYTDPANLKAVTVTDASGDQFTVYGDADGVMYSLNGAGEIIAVEGLASGATLGGALGELKSINGKTFGIIEIPESDSLHAGDGKFSVVGGSDNTIGEVVGLSGFVIVTNAGGASILRADDNILLLNAMGSASQVFAAVAGEPKSSVLTASDGFNFYLNGDSVHAIDDIDGNEVVFTNNSFDGVDKLNDKDFKVVNDADEIAVLGKDGNDGIAAVIGVGNSVDGATVAAAAGASFVLADSEGAITFGSGSKADTFTLASDADSIGVGFYINDNVAVESIDYVNREETVFGKFSSGRIVNGDSIKATDDVDNVIGVRGSQSYAGVSELYVQANASVTAWGSATSVNAMNAGSFLFTGADNQNQTFYANDTNDSILTFITDKNKVTGVQNLDDGGIAFNPNQTNALDVNTADYPAQSLTFASTESLAAFNVADRYVIAAAGFNGSISGIIAPSATVYGVDGDTDINVNGKDIFVDDADDQFNVVVHNAKPDYLYDVDGDATVLADSVSVRANSAGTDTNPTKDNFVIGGDSYIFDDSKDENDGFTFVTDDNGSMNKVASLEGALVINDGEWDGNINGDDFEVIDYPNKVNPPVTVNSGASGIESVGGLDHKDTVNGDLGKAQVHIPGYGEEGGKYPATTITINGKPYTVVTDPDGVDVTGDNADVITDLDNQASLIGAEGDVTVNGTELEPEDGDVIKGDRDDNSHARIVGDDELIRQATAINHYNHKGYDVDTDATTAAAFNIEDVVGLPTYTGAPTAYLDRYDTDAINAGSSAIDFNQPLIVSLWNFADGEFQKDEQVFDMSSYSYTKKVYMNGDGPQAVKFNNAGGNLAVVDYEATGVKQISLGSGGDAVVMDEDYALQNAVYIYGGVGDDSVFVRHNANTYIDFSAGGEDILVTAGEANARVTIDGYNASTGAAIRVEEYLDVENQKAGTIAQGIENGIISFDEGIVRITTDEGSSEINVGTNGYGGQIVNLMTHVTSGNDSLQAVGFTGSDGGIVDGSTYTSPLIMIGNDDNTKTAGSSLVGGLANDTFYAGADDTVEVGYGNDYVSLYNDSLRGGAYVDIGYGRATIDGMNNTLADSSGDVISVAIDPQDATFSLVYNASLGTVEIESAADGYYALLTDVDTLEGNYTTQYIYDETGTELYSVAIGTVNSTIKVTEDEDLRPNVFFGYQTAIDFRDYTGDAIIDLKGDMAESIIDETIVIIDDDITTLYAGAGDTALKGDLDDETLYAGKGNTWLYGDGGKNLLVGYEGADKEGQTVFYVLGNEDGAAHTISGFNYVTDDNFTDTKKVTADALEFDLDDNNITRIDISGNDLVIEITDKAGNDTESALLKDAINADGTGKDFIVSDNVAQVAENHLVFDQFADYYYATGKNATVEVSGRIEDDVVLWLDEDETGKVFEGDIAVIDATGSDATAQLAGNENDNAIFAGTGETSLWGGEGGNDVLVGNAGGRDTFYYSFGNGDDTITNVKDGDVIALDVSLDQIDEIDMSDASAIRIIMNDGDVLTINDAGHDVNVMIDNGEDGTDTYSTREARSRQ